MAELNLKQIVDKLNTEFTGEHRKLVFWYDDAADFAADIYSSSNFHRPCTIPYFGNIAYFCYDFYACLADIYLRTFQMPLMSVYLLYFSK